MNRLRKVFFKAIAICLGLIVGLAAVETAIRLLGVGPRLPREYGNNVSLGSLLYKPKPLSRIAGRNNTDEFDYDYRHNSFGFRDVEHDIVKTKTTFRILGLGDSFTYGAGVGFEETYLYRLEKMLNSRTGEHPKVEIIKAGIPRYFPESERILLEEYAPLFQPDLVMVGFLPNDVIDTYMGLDAVMVDEGGYLKNREAAGLGRLGAQVYRYSHVGRIVIDRYVAWKIAKKYQPRSDEIFQAEGFHETDWALVEQEYGKMAAIANSVHARFVIFHIPQKGPWSEKHRYPGARLSAWATTRSATFADMLPAMERASALNRLYYEKDGHCTPAGHATIADELYRYLTDHQFIL